MELELHAAHEEARTAALSDELTRLYNRRAFFEFGNPLLSQARRHNYPLALIMMDLDLFKQVNDTFGHDAGDEVLRQVSALLRDRIRKSDIVARMGGEEFALLLPETDADQALEMTERFLNLLKALTVHHQGHAIRPSASFGITLRAAGDQRLEDLLRRADRALYRAKDLGRGQANLEVKDVD